MARGSRRSETVRGEYASGTGWEAGQVAPSTKWVDEDGKVVDKEPKGVSRVLVFEGDVVRPHMVEAIKDGGEAYARRGDVSNENSPGDASHGRRGRRGTAADGTTPPAGAGTTES